MTNQQTIANRAELCRGFASICAYVGDDAGARLWTARAERWEAMRDD